MQPKILYSLTTTQNFENDQEAAKMLRSDLSPQGIQDQLSQPFEISPIDAMNEERFDTVGIAHNVPVRNTDRAKLLRSTNSYSVTRKRDMLAQNVEMPYEISFADTSEFIKTNDVRSLVYINSDTSPCPGPDGPSK